MNSEITKFNLVVHIGDITCHSVLHEILCVYLVTLLDLLFQFRAEVLRHKA